MESSRVDCKRRKGEINEGDRRMSKWRRSYGSSFQKELVQHRLMTRLENVSDGDIGSRDRAGYDVGLQRVAKLSYCGHLRGRVSLLGG